MRVSLKIVDKKENQYYYMTVEPKSKKTGKTVNLLTPEIIIANGTKKIPIKVNPNTTYSVQISETNVKSMEELLRKQADDNEENLIGPVLKTVQFTADGETKLLKVHLNNRTN
ncbi:hypothetical protein WMZ97_20775 [Lentibacillus sp. N15]|uniref:hypothetical protein n=1 Tax=Lentibacillus songyuanensis TaxID=3136161 RepID=UPI0031BB379F